MCNLFVLKTFKQLKTKAKFIGTKHAGLDSVIYGCGRQDCTELLKGTGVYVDMRIFYVEMRVVVL